MSDNVITEVEISFFKPTGYADTYYVDTKDRGLAAYTVMGLYKDQMALPALNYINTRHVSRSRVDSIRVILPPMQVPA